MLIYLLKDDGSYGKCKCSSKKYRNMTRPTEATRLPPGGFLSDGENGFLSRQLVDDKKLGRCSWDESQSGSDANLGQEWSLTEHYRLELNPSL